MIAMTSAPRLYCASSDASGRLTLMMMSASFSASALTVAPTAVNSESGRPDLTPAPGSTAISAPSALNFFTVSGEAATRGSDGSISLATAIFIGPPATRTKRARELSVTPATFRYRFWNRLVCKFYEQPPALADATVDGSGQEDRHQDDDERDRDRAVLHQFDEALIGLLVGNVVVAVGGGVRHFAMVSHGMSPVESRILGLGYLKPSSRATAGKRGFPA